MRTLGIGTRRVRGAPFGPAVVFVCRIEGRWMMNWDDLRFFLAVARCGSLSAAAATVSSSVATVSRRVDALEKAVGTRLFQRLPTGYTLTATGCAILTDAERAEAAVATLVGRVQGMDASPAGLVRLAAPPAFVEYLLVPRLPALLARYPGLQIELMTGAEKADINRGQADLAFRAARPDGGDRTRLRRLADFAFGLYGSKDFVSRHTGTKGQWPERLPVIVQTPADEPQASQRWLARTLPDAAIVLRVTMLREAVAACRLGIGATVLPRFMVEGDPDLAPIGGDPAFMVPKWLVLHSAVAETARVRAVADWLVALFPPSDLPAAP